MTEKLEEVEKLQNVIGVILTEIVGKVAEINRVFRAEIALQNSEIDKNPQKIEQEQKPKMQFSDLDHNGEDSFDVQLRDGAREAKKLESLEEEGARLEENDRALKEIGILREGD